MTAIFESARGSYTPADLDHFRDFLRNVDAADLGTGDVLALMGLLEHAMAIRDQSTA